MLSVIEPLPVAPEGPPVSVLVTGSRKWRNNVPIHRDLKTIEVTGRLFVVIEGDADGADKIAGRGWAAKARSRGVGWESMPAKWTEHGGGCWCKEPYPAKCPWAGPRRNRQMLDYLLQCRELGHVCVVLAYPLPDSKGTIDMMNVAREAGVRVFDRNPAVKW